MTTSTCEPRITQLADTLATITIIGWLGLAALTCTLTSLGATLRPARAASELDQVRLATERAVSRAGVRNAYQVELWNRAHHARARCGR
jgi:hypothetical protein